ncbi:hypothetical protein J1605_007074 [Eschrichtius robustus]|uniref:Uncharacterized protein n=1 Tax=Eschrichtius robustus TaxID=9764 RepID=A0AB34GYB1_ESCRO|nr:hypothetical protein J1605_007074 [Eschrichtius robustus]
MATPGSEPQPFVPTLSVATLHPHHHPPPHHQHHGGAGASGGAGGGGGGGGGFNLPLNRGLERALEEAANSGGLNLSARKLKEFPRTAAPAHDLSDTVQAGERGPRAGGGRGWLSGWLSSLPRRGGQSEIWPCRGTSGPCSPEEGTRVGAAAPGEPGCSGPLGPLACVSAWVSGSPSAAAVWGKWPPGWGLRARPVRAVEVGGFRRLRPLSGPRVGAGNPAAVSAPPLCVEASPVLVGKPRQRWRALRRPEGIGAVPRGPRGDITERSGNLVPTARRCRGFSFLRLCEEGAAAESQRNRIAATLLGGRLPGSLPLANRPRGLVPATEAT